MRLETPNGFELVERTYKDEVYIRYFAWEGIRFLQQ